MDTVESLKYLFGFSVALFVVIALKEYHGKKTGDDYRIMDYLLKGGGPLPRAIAEKFPNGVDSVNKEISDAVPSGGDGGLGDLPFKDAPAYPVIDANGNVVEIPIGFGA